MEKYAQGKHPNSRDHGFKPGVSGNPKGRPKGATYLSEALRELLRNRSEVKKIAERIIKDAQAGNYNAINFLAERTEGKIPQGLIGVGEITIKVVYDDDRSPTPQS
jgi:hypothetical protein